VQIEKIVERENGMFIEGLDAQMAKLKEKELSAQYFPKESELKLIKQKGRP
jgi:hypothetical protein